KPKRDLKMTFNKMGRFTFSRWFSKLHDLKKGMFAKFGFDDSGNLHIKIIDSDDGESFKILNTQNYYYVTIPKTMYADFKLQKGENVTFLLTEAENQFYKMEKNTK